MIDSIIIEPGASATTKVEDFSVVAAASDAFISAFASTEIGATSIEATTASKRASQLKTQDESMEERAWMHYKAFEPRLRNVSRMLADS